VSFAYLAGRSTASGNNASCVLKVTARDGRSLLLPGDIERTAETALLAGPRERLAAQVMVAPHHGSATSSGGDFIDAVHPAWVLFATGYRNRFGFPRPEVAGRYRDAGARSVNTAHAGAVAVRIEAGRAIRVENWRRRHPRLWRQPG
jgi:competence protein ComEC